MTNDVWRIFWLTSHHDRSEAATSCSQKQLPTDNGARRPQTLQPCQSVSAVRRVAGKIGSRWIPIWIRFDTICMTTKWWKHDWNSKIMSGINGNIIKYQATEAVEEAAEAAEAWGPGVQMPVPVQESQGALWLCKMRLRKSRYDVVWESESSSKRQETSLRTGTASGLNLIIFDPRCMQGIAWQFVLSSSSGCAYIERLTFTERLWTTDWHIRSYLHNFAYMLLVHHKNLSPKFVTQIHRRIRGPNSTRKLVIEIRHRK